MNIVEIIMNRDGVTESEAKEMISECRKALMNGDEYAVEDYLGLEPDYMLDII